MTLERSKTIQLQPIRQQTLQSFDGIPNEALQNVLCLLKFGNGQSLRKPRFDQVQSVFYISPVGKFTLIYNLVYFIFFYTLQIHISLTMAFGLNFLTSTVKNDVYNTYYWILVSFFVFDIVVTLNKGYYDGKKGKIIFDYKKILRRYFVFQQWIDIVSVCLLILPQVQTKKNHQFIQFIPLLLMWFKKFNHQEEIVTIIQYKKTTRIVFILFILACDILLIGHYVACIFLKIDLALKEQNYYGNKTHYYWILNNGLSTYYYPTQPWYIKYIFAQSFATGTLSTIAPGPFPKNPIQVIFTIGVIIFFMLLASYVGEVLIQIIQFDNQKRRNYQQSIHSINKFMLFKKVERDLITKINNFLEIVWAVKVDEQKKTQNTAIDLLPSSLKQELILQMSFINNFTLLEYFPNFKSLKIILSQKIKRIILNSDTYLFKKASNDTNDESLCEDGCPSIYFLKEGFLKYFLTVSSTSKGSIKDETKQNRNSNNSLIQNHQIIEDEEKHHIFGLSNTSKYIGIFEFITSQPFEYNCKTLDLCVLNTISRKQFMQAIQLTQNLQFFHKIKYQILLQNKINLINKACLICSQNLHVQSKCPKIFVNQKIKINMLEKRSFIGKDQQRNQSIDRDLVFNKNSKIPNKSRKLSKVQKVYNKNKPLIKKKNEQNQKENQIENQKLFNTFISSNKQSIGSILLKIAKTELTQKSSDWKDYFPSFNASQINLKAQN